MPRSTNPHQDEFSSSPAPFRFFGVRSPDENDQRLTFTVAYLSWPSTPDRSGGPE